MVANVRKLKSWSRASSPSPPDRLIFFTDTTLGRRIVPDALRTAGEEVKVQDDLFSPGLTDREWLHVAGENQWIVLTEDPMIRFHKNVMTEFSAARIRAFVLAGKEMAGAEVGATLVKALPGIKNFCAAHSGPFIAGINSDGTVTQLP